MLNKLSSVLIACATQMGSFNGDEELILMFYTLGGFFKYPLMVSLGGVNGYRATVASCIGPSANSVSRSKCALCFRVEKLLTVVGTV